MTGKKLKQALGLDRPAPIPGKYEPQLKFTIVCDRNKQTAAFSVPLPIEGFVPDIFALIHEKIRTSFTALGIMRPLESRLNPAGEENGQAKEKSTAGERTTEGGQEKETDGAATGREEQEEKTRSGASGKEVDWSR